jgi:hypothetical protein
LNSALALDDLVLVEKVFFFDLCEHFLPLDIYGFGNHVAKCVDYLFGLIFLVFYVFYDFLGVFITFVQPALQIIETAGCLALRALKALERFFHVEDIVVAVSFRIQHTFNANGLHFCPANSFNRL